MNSGGNGEISNEFFKKLNQQIVQKDNLIKLLQLQIRNLKTQIESGGADAEEAVELKKALDEKAQEVERLVSEQGEQKVQFEEFTRKKDEEIETLNRLLEESQTSGDSVEIVEDPRIPELESLITSLREELQTERSAREELEKAAAMADETTPDSEEDAEFIQQLRIENEVMKVELSEANAGLEKITSELEQIVAAKTTTEHQLEELQQQLEQASSAESEPDIEKEELRTKTLELEQDVVNLRQLLAEKEESIAAASSTIPSELEEEINQLRADSSKVTELEETIAKLQAEADSSTEVAMRLAAVEAEREQLAEALEKASAESGSTVSEDEAQSLRLEIANLKESLNTRDEEISRLRMVIDSGDDESMIDPAIREDVEQLTRQAADQLLAIQKFEAMLAEAHEAVEQKEAEINKLKGEFEQTSEPKISAEGDADIITSFIDFFDGLGSIISKNPLPELQALHQKLLDRLIVPNKIAYMPALAEEFSSDMHIATDFFRSSNFPEKCVVFEVEKGYLKGDEVIKKAKVWVVQNLYNCPECDATQGNAESKFCHLCGTRIMAPNGLPIDSLPEFEPTSTTYQHFAERMFEKGNHDKASEYLQAGLAIDGNSVPLMVRYADVLVGEAKFDEAMELLTRASKIKQDPKIIEKIKGLEAKLSIFKQAQSLKLAPEEFEKLLNLIQKQP